jgi:N-acetylglucosamine-6-sulfatase
MFLLNSLRQTIRRAIAPPRADRRLHHRGRPSRRLALEQLESRQLLSATTQPNIVFIMSDDQDVATMQYMPQVQELLAAQGVTFENSFVTTSVCCPSNVTALTGQYTNHHGVLNNGPPNGGFQKFVAMRTDRDPATQGDESTLATWLNHAGYNTARVGKYLVQYPIDSTYVPPGWDEWYATYGGEGRYFNYAMNENRQVVRYGSDPEDYATDVLTNKAIDFINRAEANDAQPFFLQFTPSAPHADSVPDGPATPAPRHAGMFAGVQAPRTPSFNEADVSDKPSPIRNFPLLTGGQIAAIDREYQTRLESLQALDEGIARIIDTLAARGELENTYIVFTSDNGYHLGQHRLRNGKFQMYEEDIRVPLIIRGPGIQAGVTLKQMAVNIDLAPTMARWGRATPDRVMDGQSLTPLLGPGAETQNWRKDFLLELYREVPPVQNGDVIKALRTEHEIYVEYRSGPRELYDLRTDPYQLQNLYATADPGHIANLSRRLAELAVSHGDPAKIESVVVNDGSAQRSMVNSLTITFDRVVTFDPGAFGLQRDDGSEIGLNVAASVVGGRTVAVLTFSGSDIIGGSLADGNYTLTLWGDQIRDLVGRELDGDHDGNGGGDRVDAFFLFGDGDDAFHVVRSADELLVYHNISPGGEPTQRISLIGLTELTIDGGAGNDSLIVDSGIPGSLGIDRLVYNAGSGVNSLALKGGTARIDSTAAGGSLNTMVAAGAHLSTSRLQQNALTLAGATSRVTILPGPGAPGQASVLTSLDLASGATLDTTDNALVIDYTDASPAATIHEKILAGRGGAGLGATWDGAGITSSTAAAANGQETESRSVAYAENGILPLGPYTIFRGQAVDETTILIVYTRTGDANLDGLVNDDDATILGAAYSPGVPQPSWALADFDYNGFVDDDDVTLLGAFYQRSNPAAAAVSAPPHEDELLDLLTEAVASDIETLADRTLPVARRDRASGDLWSAALLECQRQR